MKRYTLSLAALAMAASMETAAQGFTTTQHVIPEDRLVKAEQNYLACLASNNAGLIESAMAQIVRFKLLFPDRELKSLRQRLEEISINGPTASIKYKAYLAGSVLDNPALMATVLGVETMTSEELFSAIAGRLRITLLGDVVQ